MSKTVNFWRRPYYFEEDITKRAFYRSLAAVFIFLFLYIFQPFQLNTYPGNKFQLILGYGLVTLVIDLLFQVVFLYSFPRWFRAEQWTTGKEILYTLAMVLCIGLGNLLYSNWMDVTNLSLANLLLFEGYTFAVAIFPIYFLVFGKERREHNQHQLLSDEISQQIPKQTEATSETVADLIKITASNGSLALEAQLDQIYYLKSEANYVEIYFMEESKLQKMLIRNTLKAMEAQLDQEQFFRCHKSYMVNLSKIERLSGNAQGLKLHLKDVDQIVPVSRKNNDILKSRFATHP